MRGLAEAMQRAIYSALRSSASVQSLFTAAGPRIFDEVPSNPTFPYIVIGDDQVLDDSHCSAAYEVHSTIHVFSRKSGAGLTEAKQIGDAITAALSGGDVSIEGFTSIVSDIESALSNTKYFYDPDQLTAHGVLVFRFLVDQL